jgi:hypothetical protein
MPKNKPTAWAHLPNAAHIDRVLAHAKANPAKWTAAWDAAWGVAWDAALAAALDAALDADLTAALDTARDVAWDAALDAAWGACAALITWDYASELMSYTPEQLKFLVDEGAHAAVLLYPAVLAMYEDKSVDIVNSKI